MVTTTPTRRGARLVPLLAATLLAVSAPAVAATGRPHAPRTVAVVAAENFWGSIAAQVGGAHVKVTSIITNPDTDPHEYEPTAADARTFATAQLAIVNGVGYDPWATELAAANGGGGTVLDVGTVLGLAKDANPHRWYNPADVQRVVTAVVADLARIDPADGAAFRSGGRTFEQRDLATYRQLVQMIHRRFVGTRVGASESIFAMLAPALGLDLVTPATFLRAISDGTDVSAAEVTTIDQQITGHRIAIYVYNSQNATPDVAAQLALCRKAGIPVAHITETLAPAGATYQSWQVAQLRGILSALENAAAR